MLEAKLNFASNIFRPLVIGKRQGGEEARAICPFVYILLKVNRECLNFRKAQINVSTAIFKGDIPIVTIFQLLLRGL